MIRNSNTMVLIDSAGELRRMRHYLISNNIPYLKKKKEVSSYPIFYYLRITDNEMYAKMTESVTWFDKDNVKHSFFDTDQPYTDVVNLKTFFEKGGWVSCEEE